MRSTLLLAALIFVASCVHTNKISDTHELESAIQLTSDSPGIFVANYNDFGPPQLSKALLGNKWWQWNAPDNHRPVKYKVKIVVYKGVDINSVKRFFPVIPEKKQDYRYISYSDAVEYFDRTIAELEGELAKVGSSEEAGLLSIYPLKLYKTALALERKLK